MAPKGFGPACPSLGCGAEMDRRCVGPGDLTKSHGGVRTGPCNLRACRGPVRGFLIAQIFFGLWLIPLGYLAYRSGMFPKALGLMLNVAGVCYLADTLVLFLVPDFGKQVNAFLVIPPMIGEVSMAAYLLVKGVRSSPATDRAPIAAEAAIAVSA
jgi:hypothetical protein